MSGSMELFNSVLGATFAPSRAFMIQGERATLDFLVEVTGETLAKIEWYFEFTSEDPNDPDAIWYRELAEQNTAGSGTTNMPKVVRVFQERDGTLLAAGEHALDAQCTRAHNFTRIQIAVTQGTASAVVRAPFATQADSPPPSTA